MKFPNGKKYGSNSDERESLFPEQFDLETKSNESNVKKQVNND